jgi:hypothetical protein
MYLLSLLLLFIAQPCNQPALRLDHPLCQSSDFMLLKDKKMQAAFFQQRDSVLRVQYPGGNREPGEREIFVELTPAMLNQFLKDIDLTVLREKGEFEKEYYFKIAPKGYTDPAKCKDKIVVTYYPDECSYRIEIHNTFMVEDGWCTESQVSYGFKIEGKKIKGFSRNAAG